MAVTTLVKFVMVSTASGYWLDMSDSLEAIRAEVARTPGTHAEQWTYQVNAEGTHDGPFKYRLPVE